MTRINTAGAQTVFANNPSALIRFVYNAGTTDYYLSLSTPASATNYFAKLGPGQLLEIPEITQAIYGLEASGTPDIRATEVASN